LAGLAAADVLVGDQQVAGAVEDDTPDPLEAVAPRDERPEARPRGGVEALHAVVTGVAVPGVVADVEDVPGRWDVAGPPPLQGEAGAVGLAGAHRAKPGLSEGGVA